MCHLVIMKMPFSITIKLLKTLKICILPGLVSSYNYLATTYAAAGQTEEADYYYKKLITGRIELLDPGHPLLAYDYLSYGDFLTSQGNLDEAKKYLESALSIRINNLGRETLPYFRCVYVSGQVLFAGKRI